jgi:aryl-alcohol dehydrogenase-like predicted oxidoreductase
VVDLLQIHKATASVVTDKGVLKALEYARSRGIPAFGASVKDVEAARCTLANPAFSYVQFPYNLENRSLAVVFELAAVSGVRLIINRPFAMGALLPAGAAGVATSLRFVLEQDFAGMILMGTSSEEHLRENVAAFHTIAKPVV